MAYRDSKAVCQRCGSTSHDRFLQKPKAPQGFEACPACETDKYCLCGPLQNVQCPICDTDPGGDGPADYMIT